MTSWIRNALREIPQLGLVGGLGYKCLRISYLQHFVVNKNCGFDSGSRT